MKSSHPRSVCTLRVRNSEQSQETLFAVIDNMILSCLALSSAVISTELALQACLNKHRKWFAIAFIILYTFFFFSFFLMDCLATLKDWYIPLVSKSELSEGMEFSQGSPAVCV